MNARKRRDKARNALDGRVTYLAQLGGCVDILLDGFEDGRVPLEQGAIDAAAAALQLGRVVVGTGDIGPLHGSGRHCNTAEWERPHGSLSKRGGESAGNGGKHDRTAGQKRDCERERAPRISRKAVRRP